MPLRLPFSTPSLGEGFCPGEDMAVLGGAQPGGRKTPGGAGTGTFNPPSCPPSGQSQRGAIPNGVGAGGKEP